MSETPLRFDPDALRQRYARERENRLRVEGTDQYIEIAGERARYGEDPHVAPGFTREPVAEEIDVALVGAGFGGLLTGARLRQLGVADVRLIDKAADVGGTWYWNRYPGIACDIESYIYIPLLEELDYMPSEKYSRGREIFEHCRRIANHYDLYRDALLQTEVTSITWDAASSRWTIRTDRGDELRARFVSLSNGFLQKPKLPGIPGIDDFSGHSFHTSRWDYEYTGGDAGGGLNKLADKRIGIIGTGATAVQCIPHLAEAAAHLYVFQRTPSSVDVRDNRPTDPTWAASLEPGWQRRRIENFQVLTAGGHAEEDLVSDAWTDITRKLLSIAQANKNPDMSPEALARMVELADFTKMEEIRARVDSIVVDPDTAEALKPFYRQFCKRPCFHDGYLQTFNRPNVTLVDTHGRGVGAITARGVVVDDVEYELDCLVFATGFEVGTDYCRRSGFPLVGKDGLTLTDKWSDGVRTLHGLHVHGFPNCFVQSTAQAGLTVNFPYLIDLQATHVAWIVEQCLADGIQQVEATAEAEAGWVAQVVRRGARMAESSKSCTPSYYNNEGQPTEKTAQGSFFFGAPTEFAEILASWRASGTWEGIERTASA